MHSPQTRLNTSNPEQEPPLAHAPHMSCTDSAANVMTTQGRRTTRRPLRNGVKGGIALARQPPPRQITPGDTRSGAAHTNKITYTQPQTYLCLYTYAQAYHSHKNIPILKKTTHPRLGEVYCHGWAGKIWKGLFATPPPPRTPVGRNPENINCQVFYGIINYYCIFNLCVGNYYLYWYQIVIFQKFM